MDGWGDQSVLDRSPRKRLFVPFVRYVDVRTGGAGRAELGYLTQWMIPGEMWLWYEDGRSSRKPDT